MIQDACPCTCVCVQKSIFSKIVLYIYGNAPKRTRLVLFYYWDKSVPGVPLMMLADGLGSTVGMIPMVPSHLKLG